MTLTLRIALCLAIGVGAAALAAGQAAAQSAPAEAKSAQPETLAALLAQLAALEGLRARFVEEKHIAFLKQPLRSEGSVAFAAPGLLLRKAERPEASAMLLSGETLRVWDGTSVRRIELGESAIVRHFVLTFVYVLRGDRAALERLYALAFSVKDGQWRLELTPKEAQLARVVKRAALEGSGAKVARMTLLEASGDTTVMTFTDVDTRARFDADARARTFRLPGD